LEKSNVFHIFVSNINNTKMNKKLIYSAVALFATILLISCSSTKLLSSWKTDVPEGTTNKVLVFSLIGKKAANLEFQDSFEDAVVKHLKSVGVDAYSAYDVFGPNALKQGDKEYLAKKIREDKYTGILLLTYLDKDQQDEYVPPTTTTYAVPTGPVYYDPWFHPYFNCYNYYYDQVTTPGYWTTTTTYILEARLFNAMDEKDAVYVGTTSTKDPSDAQTAAKEFANTIISDMKTKAIIK